MRSFITGSRAYGDPLPDSDVDLVVQVSPRDLAILRNAADKVLGQETHGRDGCDYSGVDAASLQFGRLNLIAVTDDAAFGVWLVGTRRLQRGGGRPIARSRAMALFTVLRNKLLGKGPHKEEA